MRLNTRTIRGITYVYYLESYRDPKSHKPRSRIVKSFGRLDRLLEQDPDIMQKLRREVEEINTAHKSLEADELRQSLDEFFKGSGRGAENTTKCCATLNYGIALYRNIWNSLRLSEKLESVMKRSGRKIEFDFSETVFLMTAFRLLNPCSRRATFRLKDSTVIPFEGIAGQDMYKALRELSGFKTVLEKHLFRELSKRRQRNLCVAFYDVTTFAFESTLADEEGLKNFGFSKDKKFNEVQVVLGLLMDSDGIPLGYELCAGNTSEYRTLIPALKRMKREYGVKEVIIVADRGLNSGANLAAIKRLGMDYVMAMKVRGCSEDLRQKIFDSAGYTEKYDEETGAVAYKYKILPQTRIVRVKEGNGGTGDNESRNKDRNEDSHQKSNEKSNKAVKEELEEQLLISYSEKRARKDAADRQRLVKKAERLISSPSAYRAELKKGGKSYVKVSVGEELVLDTEKIAEQMMFDGYYGIVTSRRDLEPEKIASIHHNLWKIEENFRIMKSCLEARPCFVWTDRSIAGHFLVCYLALFIQKLLENEVREAGIAASTNELLEAAKSAQVLIIENYDMPVYMKVNTKPLFDKVCELYNMKPLRTWNKKAEVSRALNIGIR